MELDGIDFLGPRVLYKEESPGANKIYSRPAGLHIVFERARITFEEK